MYTAFFTPFILAFLNNEAWNFWFIIDLIIDLSFLTDVILTFNTAYSTENSLLETSRNKIILNYIYGWFIIDLLASIPIGIIEIFFFDEDEDVNGINNLLRIFRMRSMAKFLRMPKFAKFIKHYNVGMRENIQYLLRMSHSGFRTMTFLFWIILSLHIVTCTWWFAAKQQGLTDDTWVGNYNVGDSIFETYLVSLYWAITTVSTVGYGDISPMNNAEIIVAIIWMTAGMYIFSYAVSSMSTSLTKVDSENVLIEEKMEILEIYAKKHCLSKKLVNKIGHLIKTSGNHSAHTQKREDSLLKGFTVDLRKEIAMNMHGKIVFDVDIFCNSDERFLGAVIPFLRLKKYESLEFIYIKGEPSNGVYFVAKGEAFHVMKNLSININQVVYGEYFGAFEMIEDINRTYTVKSGKTLCHVLIMKKHLLEKVKNLFPTKYNELKQNAFGQEKELDKKYLQMKLSLENNLRRGILSNSFNDKYIEQLVKKKNEKKPKTLDDIYSKLTEIGELVMENRMAIKQLEKTDRWRIANDKVHRHRSRHLTVNLSRLSDYD